jgi:hypothetical protein
MKGGSRGHIRYNAHAHECIRLTQRTDTRISTLETLYALSVQYNEYFLCRMHMTNLEAPAVDVASLMLRKDW